MSDIVLDTKLVGSIEGKFLFRYISVGIDGEKRKGQDCSRTFR